MNKPNTTERQRCNFYILNELMNYVINNPDIRFIQALWNVNIIDRVENSDNVIRDRFFEEPNETLKRMRKVMYAECETSKKSEETV